MSAPKKKQKHDVRGAVDQARTAPDVAAHPDRFAAEELVGESEYSTREAGEREVSRHGRAPGGAADHEPLAATPDTLGRRYLEEATESPGPEELDPDMEAEGDDTADPEQVSTRIDARRDPAADPLHQTRSRRGA